MNQTKRLQEQPICSVYWVHRDRLVPNNYNPNFQYDSATNLLAVSIMEDGWTQPIVVTPKHKQNAEETVKTDLVTYVNDVTSEFEIVDGFHRWLVSGRVKLYMLTGGFVPIVVIWHDNEQSQKLSTIRHNRASGEHAVLEMSKIVASMIENGMSMQEICFRAGMEKEEVKRLSQRAGIPADSIFEDGDWGKEWISDINSLPENVQTSVDSDVESDTDLIAEFDSAINENE